MRVSTIPASRKSVAETSPCATDWTIAPVDPELGEREEAEHDQAHLRHRGVRRHGADVRGAEREQRAVDEARSAANARIAFWKSCDRLGKHRDHDPQQPVDGRLGDDAGEDRRDLRRRLAIGVDQPAVEGEDRRLDREGGEEAEEEPLVGGRSQGEQRERPLREPENDDRREHQQRAGHRVDDERRGRTQPPRPAPDADQDVDRDQHRLEEDVEEQQILGGEDADDRAHQEEQQPVVRAAALAVRPQRVADRGRGDDDGQPDEPEREAVEADVVGDAEVAEPAVLVLQLQPLVEVEAGDDDHPEPDLDESSEQRERTGHAPWQRQQPDHERRDEREGDQRSRHWTVMKTTMRTATAPAIASA